jgi:HK97 family phage portal protein
MRLPWPFNREARASIESPSVPVSASGLLSVLMGGHGPAVGGRVITLETALRVPAYAAGVNFISGTMAGLPLHLYRRVENGRERVTTGRYSALATILHDAVTDEVSSFQWRKSLFEQVLTTGRAFTFIERAPNGRVLNLWPLDPANVTVERVAGRKRYRYRDGGREVIYLASEVIDLAFMLKPDQLGHRGPLSLGRDAIAMALAATEYAAKLFENGGVPPLALEGPISSPGAVKRAAADVAAAIREAAKENSSVLTLPAGHTLKALGIDPDKQQLLELQRFSVEQMARLLSLPPIFLQDLTHGTFTNSEQQDLHVVKHTLKRWCEQFEQEINLKLFGRDNRTVYAELALDGLLRGDFKARMEGYAKGIQNAIWTPNEVRLFENAAGLDGGDQLLIQGATVPLTLAGQAPPVTAPPTDSEDDPAQAARSAVAEQEQRSSSPEGGSAQQTETSSDEP